nr:hypothetical protein BdHM001_31940 [Bdellovibrio sp. HM001]
MILSFHADPNAASQPIPRIIPNLGGSFKLLVPDANILDLEKPEVNKLVISPADFTPECG